MPHNNISPSETLDKAKQAGIDILASDNDLLVLKIKNFEESKLMGSKLWSISIIEEYFKGYTKDNKEQYFVFDHTKEYKDPKSLVGITLDKGKVFVAHYKDCSSIPEDDVNLKKYIDLINTVKLDNKKKNIRKLKV